MIVSCFGVHWAPGDIPFLVQALGSQNLISPELASPFNTNIRPKRQRCPHQIDLENATSPPDWLSDPLAQALLPVPRQPGAKAKAIVGGRGLEQLLTQLQRLSTPTEPLMRPIYWRAIAEVRGVYAVSNLTPLIWFGTEAAHLTEAGKHVTEAASFNRNILIVAAQRLPLFTGVEWIETGLTDVGGEPLEAIGAGLLREHMESQRG